MQLFVVVVMLRHRAVSQPVSQSVSQSFSQSVTHLPIKLAASY